MADEDFVVSDELRQELQNLEPQRLKLQLIELVIQATEPLSTLNSFITVLSNMTGAPDQNKVGDELKDRCWTARDLETLRAALYEAV